MRKVILVSGLAESGKDTTIDFMIDYLKSKGLRATKMMFAKYLKDLCRDHLGWNGEKDKKGRTLLQYVGTDQMREKLGWGEFHCGRICEDIKIVEDQYDYIFIDDARFENELYYTHAKFPGQFADLLIIRPNLESKLDKKQLTHKSENALGGYEHENKIINDGNLDDLEIYAMEFCKEVLEVI